MSHTTPIMGDASVYFEMAPWQEAFPNLWHSKLLYFKQPIIGLTHELSFVRMRQGNLRHN